MKYLSDFCGVASYQRGLLCTVINYFDIELCELWSLEDIHLNSTSNISPLDVINITVKTSSWRIIKYQFKIRDVLCN
jgi:hypothetical protein